MTVYENIDKILRERHISRRKLADLAGINANTLAAVFMRKPDPFPEKYLIPIAEALEVPVYQLKGLKLLKYPAGKAATPAQASGEASDVAFSEEEDNARVTAEFFALRTLSAISQVNLDGLKLICQYAETLSTDNRYRK